MFSKVKYSDRDKLLLPKKSVFVVNFQRKIPVLLLERFMDTTCDLHFQKKMNKEEISPMIVSTFKREKQMANTREVMSV